MAPLPKALGIRQKPAASDQIAERAAHQDQAVHVLGIDQIECGIAPHPAPQVAIQHAAREAQQLNAPIAGRVSRAIQNLVLVRSVYPIDQEADGLDRGALRSRGGS